MIDMLRIGMLLSCIFMTNTALDDLNQLNELDKDLAQDFDNYAVTCYICVNVSDNLICNQFAIDRPCKAATVFAIRPTDLTAEFVKKSLDEARKTIEDKIQINFEPELQIEFNLLEPIPGTTNVTNSYLNLISKYYVDGEITSDKKKFDVPLKFDLIELTADYSSQFGSFFANKGKAEGFAKNCELVLHLDVKNGKFVSAGDSQLNYDRLRVYFYDGESELIDLIYNAFSKQFSDIARSVIPPYGETFCHTLHIMDSKGTSVLVNKKCTTEKECQRNKVGCVEVDTQLMCVSCCDQNYCNMNVPTNSSNAIFDDKISTMRMLAKNLFKEREKALTTTIRGSGALKTTAPSARAAVYFAMAAYLIA